MSLQKNRYIICPDKILKLNSKKKLSINDKSKIFSSIYDCLKYFGLSNHVKLINSLKSRENLKELILENLPILNEKDDTDYLFNNEFKLKLYIEEYYKKGGFNKIYIVEKNNSKKLILRQQITKNEFSMSACFIDLFIHLIIFLYSKIFLKSYTHSIVPRIENVFLDHKKNKILGLMDFYDGTLKDIIFDEFLLPNEKFKIIINTLYQIAFYLIVLQNRFKFVHNDLKINNILFQKGLKFNKVIYNFVLSDFGFSRLEIFNQLTFTNMLVRASYPNSQNFKNSIKFHQNKDLYFLFHNILYFSKNNIELKNKLIEFGKNIFESINLNFLENENGWNDLYNYNACRKNRYNPNIFVNELKNNPHYSDLIYFYFNLPYQD